MEAGSPRVERRAAQRCRLQEAVRVRLSGVASNGGSKWTVQGLMLNATPLGVACRVAARDLDLLPAEGGMLQVRFDLATDSRDEGTEGRRDDVERTRGHGGGETRRRGDAETRRRFELSAKVRSLTQAGTPGYFVVGMEFTFDGFATGEQDRLREALARVM